MGEKVNGLVEILSVQLISPNLFVGRQEGFNGLLGIRILSVTLPTYLEEKSHAESTVPEYFLHILSVLLKLGGHSSNLFRVI